MSVTINVLIPTYNRPSALAVLLTSLLGQTYRNFDVFISDQSSDQPAGEDGVVQAVCRVLRAHGIAVTIDRHLPRRGMAEQRQFLLDQVTAPYALFLDDDLILEDFVLQNLLDAIVEEDCGFVGMGLIGLSYLKDVRPQQQAIEFWDGPVTPETVAPNTPQWARHTLHNAANLWHVQQRFALSPDQPRKYRLAWSGGCVLYDSAKLRSAGGFSFWKELPATHAGEDVLAQLRVMSRYGACGILPSGAYHQELPTTVEDRQIDAPLVLPITAAAFASAAEG